MLLRGVLGFTDGLREATAGAVHWLGELYGRGDAALLGLATRFINWLTPHVPEILTGVARAVGAIVGFLGTTALSLIRGVLDGDFAGAFWKWVGPAIPPLLAALGGLSDAVGTWVHGTMLPYLETNLPIWGGAFGAWAGALWKEHIEPGMGQLWASFSTWIGATAPVIAERAKVWGAALWAGLTASPKSEHLKQVQSTLAAMNGVGDFNPDATGNGMADFLNGLSTSIAIWGATTGHKAMQDALRAALTAGPSVADVGDRVIDGTKKTLDPQGGPLVDWLNSTAPKIEDWWTTTGGPAMAKGLRAALTAGPSVAQAGQTVLDWLDALADWVGPKLVASSHWINMGDLIGKAIFSGLPQWAQNGLNAIGGSGTPPPPGGQVSPGFGGTDGGSGGGGSHNGLLSMPLGGGGGGGLTINLTMTGPTTEELARSMAQQLYDALAPLLGESGGGGGGSLTTGGAVY